MRNCLKKYMRVLRELIRLRLHNMMVFRLDFFGPFFVDGTLFLVQLLAFSVIYEHIDTFGGWGRGEMILYIGTFSLINAISMTLYFFGMITIPEKVKNGELDLYLTKPVSPLFRLSFEHINFGSVPLILMSFCVIWYGIQAMERTVTAGASAGYVWWVVIMTVLDYDMEVLIRAISLYCVTTARMEQLEEACLSLCMKLPGIAFYGGYKVLFYFLLPYGIMATYPVHSMVGEMNMVRAVYGTSIVVLFSMLTGVVWKQGLKKYNSASS